MLHTICVFDDGSIAFDPALGQSAVGPWTSIDLKPLCVDANVCSVKQLSEWTPILSRMAGQRQFVGVGAIFLFLVLCVCNSVGSNAVYFQCLRVYNWVQVLPRVAVTAKLTLFLRSRSSPTFELVPCDRK